MLDNLFYIILPYAAITLAIVITVQRYLKRGFTYSSLSSQFLESDELFYGSVPWHIGILVVLLGHVIGFAIPRQVLWFNGVPARLYILETTGLLVWSPGPGRDCQPDRSTFHFRSDSRRHVVDGRGRAARVVGAGNPGRLHSTVLSLGLVVVCHIGSALFAFAVSPATRFENDRAAADGGKGTHS